MDVQQVEAVVASYLKDMHDTMEIVATDGGFCVVTPMLNRHNDCMCIYLVDSQPGEIVMTDLGETMLDLESDGFTFTETRRDRADEILRGYGMKREGKEIYVRCTESNAAARMNMLLQSMASIDDMYLTAAVHARSFFQDDVKQWLLNHDISLVPNPSLAGRSGLQFKFDFAVGMTKNRPLRLIKTVNNPTDNAPVRNAIFGWEDVHAANPDSEGYAFLNAPNTKDGRVSQDILDAFKAYNMIPVCWGTDESDFIEQLSA